MTVANVPRRQAYMANGVTTSFPVPFTFFEIAVYVDGVLKNYGPDYTITQASTGTNGTVTFGTPPLGGTSVVVVGDTAIKQETDYVDNGPFPAASHELALDRLTMAVQELRRSLGLTIRAPEYADTTPAAAIPDTNGIPLVSYERGIAPLDVGEGWLFTDANSVVHTRVALPGTAAQLIRAPVVGADVNKGVVVGTGATLTDTGLATLGDVAAAQLALTGQIGTVAATATTALSTATSSANALDARLDVIELRAVGTGALATEESVSTLLANAFSSNPEFAALVIPQLAGKQALLTFTREAIA